MQINLDADKILSKPLKITPMHFVISYVFFAFAAGLFT